MKMKILTALCALGWGGSAIIAIASPGKDYRVWFIVAAFLLCAENLIDLLGDSLK